MPYRPRIGDYGVVKTSGWVGKLIRLGTASRWNHAFIYIGNGQIVEANPTGVEISPVAKYPIIAWNKHEDLNNDQRDAVVAYAKTTVGKPYAFLVIGNIVLRILGLKILANTKILRKLAQQPGYICSELVAESYNSIGIKLYNKPLDLVTPGDLAERLIYQ